ncbi:hypothetical protein EDB80DRAFT_677093 [Ilyonectria destructans]|nr:hypothetical protein EDB80DRAFT_677093 [Ilyonectria destructans]
MAHKLAGSLRGHPVIPAPGNTSPSSSEAAQPTRTLVIVPGDSSASSRPVHGLPEKRPLFALPRRPPNSALSAIEPPPIPPVWRPWASSSALTVPRSKPKQANIHIPVARTFAVGNHPQPALSPSGKGVRRLPRWAWASLDILSSWESKTYTGEADGHGVSWLKPSSSQGFLFQHALSKSRGLPRSGASRYHGKRKSHRSEAVQGECRSIPWA